MLELTIAVMAIAIPIAISPLPLVSLLVMLVSGRSRENALAFTFGWLLAMLGVGSLVLFLLGGLSTPAQADSPAQGAYPIRAALGAALVLLAFVVWKHRPAPEREPALPRWLGTLDRLTPPVAFAAGFGMLAMNPKNLTILGFGAGEIAQLSIDPMQKLVVLTAFSLMATSTLLVVLVTYLLGGERSRQALGQVRAWLLHHGSAVVVAALALVGLWIIGGSLGPLLGGA